MKKYFIKALGLSAIVLLSGACYISLVDNSGEERFPLPGEFRQSVPLESGGTIALENGNGDILISGWDAEEVEIRADKSMSRAFGRRIQFFNKSDLEPKVRVDEQEGFIKILSEEPSREGQTATVNYKLRVPHSVNLKDILNRIGDIHISDLYGKVFINLQEGNLKIENFSGTLDASVSRGTVEAEILDLRDEDEVKILVREGDLTLTLERDAVARIEAIVPHGDLRSDFDLKSQEGTRISLTALDGNVRIMREE